MNETTRTKLLTVTKELLLNAEEPERLTARQIASAADVNLAMISYCFGSKDELLKAAVDEIVASEYARTSSGEQGRASPKESLKALLIHMAEVTLRYERIARMSIAYTLLNEPLDMQRRILPYIRAHYGERMEDRDCRTLAFELIAFLQILLCRERDFREFSGIDVHEPDELRRLVTQQVDMMLR